MTGINGNLPAAAMWVNNQQDAAGGADIPE
jgi:hypothetical protein